MDFQQLSAKFLYFEGPFPQEALIEAIENREQVIPDLLQVIQKVTDNSQQVIDHEDYTMSSYAMYLLAQFREKKAYQPIIDFFSMPDEKALEIVGDMYVEDLGRILASVSGGEISLLQQLIENPEAQELIRASALEALMVLVHVGEKNRDEIMAYFKSLFEGKLERRNSMVWVSLVSCCVDLYPEEVQEEIEDAYDDELVDEFLIERGEAHDALQLEKNRALENFFKGSQYSLIEDVVQEMAEMAAYK
jgi:hypothetical protein